VTLLLCIVVAGFLGPALSTLGTHIQPKEPTGGWVVEPPAQSVDVRSPRAIVFPIVLAIGIALILAFAALRAVRENVPRQVLVARFPGRKFMAAVGLWALGALILISALDALGHAIFPGAF